MKLYSWVSCQVDQLKDCSTEGIRIWQADHFTTDSTDSPGWFLMLRHGNTTTRPGGTPSLGTPKSQALLRPARCVWSECIQGALFRIGQVLHRYVVDLGKANWREENMKCYSCLFTLFISTAMLVSKKVWQHQMIQFHSVCWFYQSNPCAFLIPKNSPRLLSILKHLPCHMHVVPAVAGQTSALG